MSEGEGAFRVATAYVALAPMDEGFSEELAAKVEAACAKGAEAGGEEITAKLEEAVAQGSEEAAAVLVETLEEATSEAGAVVAAQLEEALTEAGAEGGSALAEGVAAGAEESLAAVQALDEQIRGLIAQNTAEADAAAEALQGRLREAMEAQAAFFEQTGAMSREQFAEAAAQAAAARDELVQIRSDIEQYAQYVGLPVHSDDAAVFQQFAEGAITAQEAVAKLTISEQEAAAGAAALSARLEQAAQVAVGAVVPAVEEAAEAVAEVGAGAMQEFTQGVISAEAPVAGLAASTQELVAANAALSVQLLATAEADAEAAAAFSASMELRTTQLTRAMLSGDGADKVIAKFGVSEAQATIATATMAQAVEDLAYQNGQLLLTYASLANGGGADLGWLQRDLSELAAAQQTVADSAAAIVAGQNEINLALIQNQVEFLNEANGLGSLASLMQATSIDAVTLAGDLENADYALLNLAAGEARAALESSALEAAQQQLAAANLTLVDTWQRLAAGEEIAAEQQSAVLGAATAAQREISALGGAAGQARSLGSGLREVDQGAQAASHSMGGMGGIMMGPWGQAAWMAMSILPMMSGMFSSTAVTAADFTQAVTQDSNAVGDNTTATIQATLAKSGLSDMSQKLGISQATLIEYAAGEKSAQDAVTAAYNQHLAAADANAKANQKTGEITRATTGTINAQAGVLYAQKEALDKVTAAVQQAIQEDQAQSDALLAAEQSTQIYNAAVAALGSQMLLNVQNTQMSNQATDEYGPKVLAAMQTTKYYAAAVGAAGEQMLIQVEATRETDAATAQYAQAVVIANLQTADFNAALDASYAKMVTSAQATAESTVGLLGLGDAQNTLNLHLYSAVNAYTMATQEAGGYNNVITALYGQYGAASAAQATFTTDLANLTTTITGGTNAVDLNTKAGAANYSAFYTVAQAAEAAAGQIYQQTGDATKATSALQQMAVQLDTAASKAGLTKDQVQQLNQQLFGVKSPGEIQITLDDSDAMNKLHDLQNGLQLALQEGGTLGSASGHIILPGRASGGPVQAGQAYVVGEQRAEVFVPDRPGYVYPSVQEGARAAAAGPTINFYGSQLPNGEELANIRREMVSALGVM